MNFENRTYPRCFPEGCPPEDAINIRLKVYRLIEGDIIVDNDFKSFKELGKDVRSNNYPFIEYGLSVNTNYDELKKVRKAVPGLKKKFKNIGSGMTYECSGVVKATPNGRQKNHHTWWIYKEINPKNFFRIEGGEL